jgi:hypothetical protein
MLISFERRARSTGDNSSITQPSFHKWRGGGNDNPPRQMSGKVRNQKKDFAPNRMLRVPLFSVPPFCASGLANPAPSMAALEKLFNSTGTTFDSRDQMTSRGVSTHERQKIHRTESVLQTARNRCACH